DWAPNTKDAGLGLATLAPLNWISAMSLTLLAAALAVGSVLWLQLRGKITEKRATWGCGYVAPTSRMQYTASSVCHMFVGLFGWALQPRAHQPKDMPLFPRTTAFHSVVHDTVLDEAVMPTFRFGAWLFSWFRVFQQGSVQTYLLYIVIALIALLLW